MALTEALNTPPKAAPLPPENSRKKESEVLLSNPVSNQKAKGNISDGDILDRMRDTPHAAAGDPAAVNSAEMQNLPESMKKLRDLLQSYRK